MASSHKQTKNPRAVLIEIVNDFLAQGDEDESGTPTSITRIKNQTAISDKCAELGINLTASSNRLDKLGASTKSLSELITEEGHSAIEMEITRALEEKDPASKVLYAVNTLESTLKVFLQNSQISLNENATLADLWKSVSQQMKLSPKNIEDDNIRRLASSFFGPHMDEPMNNLRNTVYSTDTQNYVCTPHIRFASIS